MRNRLCHRMGVSYYLFCYTKIVMVVMKMVNIHHPARDSEHHMHAHNKHGIERSSFETALLGLQFPIDDTKSLTTRTEATLLFLVAGFCDLPQRSTGRF